MTASKPQVVFADRWWRCADGAWGVAPPHSEDDEARADHVLAHYSRLIDSDATPPTTSDLIRWWTAGGCPADALEEVENRLAELLAGVDDGYGEMLKAWDLRVLAIFGAGVHGELVPRAQIVGSPSLQYGFHCDISALAALHGDGHGFCLAPVILEWQRSQPKAVEPERRLYRILPSKLAQVQPGDRRAPRLFSPAAHSPDGQRALPGFGAGVDPATPALPLALYDLGVGAGRRTGKGAAPLPLRMFVEAVLLAPATEAKDGAPISFQLTLRELLGRLWPHPKGQVPSPAKYWEPMMKAIDALESQEARIPWYDPNTGQGGLIRVVSFRNIPRGPGHLDDPLWVMVDLPPGSHVGPMVGPNLGYWGKKSSPTYRLYLNLAFRLFEPGRTHVPVGKGPRMHWVPSDDPKRFERLSDDDLVHMAFPTSTNQAKRNLRLDARAALKRLVDQDDFRMVEGRIMPPKRRD